jgi:DNA-directed RNA polymerase specialized sigma24 family protein
MAADESDLAELKATKAAIDDLQAKLKDLVTKLREQGLSAQDIAAALRG